MALSGLTVMGTPTGVWMETLTETSCLSLQLTFGGQTFDQT